MAICFEESPATPFFGELELGGAGHDELLLALQRGLELFGDQRVAEARADGRDDTRAGAVDGRPEGRALAQPP